MVTDRSDVTAMIPMPTPPHASFPRCPICGSWDVQRHSENFRVWFTCRRCGREFTR